MKLFVITVLVTVAAAARLEHLERSYLPPDYSSNGGFGSPSYQGSFGANSGAFGAAGAGLQGNNAGAPFAGATSNQYLPPDHGPSASNGAPQFAGSLQGFGSQNIRSQQYNGLQAAPAQQYNGLQAAPVQQYSGLQAAPAQQYAAPSSQYGSPQAISSFGAPRNQAQFPQQFASASRQYLAPKTGSYQQPPQQAFDEQTGYHY